MRQIAAAAEHRRVHRRETLRGIVADLRAKGIASVRALAAELNERGVLTPGGGTWHPTSAARLLSRLKA